MPHIQQGLVRKSKSISTRTELEKRSKNYRNNHVGLESSQIQFETKTDENSAYSPPFWSKTSCLQVIPDGRRELIKMVQNMLESSFDLSLKDIVEDRTNVQEEQQEVAKKIEQKNRKFRRSQMLRSQSVDSGVFLLKLFLPACLSLRKRSMIGKSSKVSQSPLFDGSEKVVDKEWWSVRFLVSGKSKNSCSSSRNSHSSFTPGCWPSDDLYKSRRQSAFSESKKHGYSCSGKSRVSSKIISMR